jgi:hypothetical protein
MSTLKMLIERLRRQVLDTSASVFEQGRGKQPALALHEDIASVLAALADDHEATYPARDALTRALLAMHRSGKAELWSCALAVAYFPMLSRLRHRIVGDAVPREELDQLVLTAFWSALAELPPGGHGSDRLPMRLRQRTQRLVFQTLRKEREQQHASLDDDSQVLEQNEVPVSVRDGRSAAEDRLDLAILLEKAAADGIPQASLEVLAATVLRHELLRSYVSRIGPTDVVDRERLYQRLKRQRSRVLRRLRDLAGEPSGTC